MFSPRPRLTGGLLQRLADRGVCSSPPAIPDTRPALERALDQLVEAVAVALLEGRALRLAVVGEHDELVGPGREPAGPGDAAELLVELAQGLQRVGALEPGVVRDLVVAREGRVDGGTAAHHVGQHAVDDQVADDHAQRGAQERVEAAAVPAGDDVAAPLARSPPMHSSITSQPNRTSSRVTLKPLARKAR